MTTLQESCWRRRCWHLPALWFAPAPAQRYLTGTTGINLTFPHWHGGVSAGKLLAVALLDCTIKVFFLDSLRFFLSLYGHKLPVRHFPSARQEKYYTYPRETIQVCYLAAQFHLSNLRQVASAGAKVLCISLRSLLLPTPLGAPALRLAWREASRVLLTIFLMWSPTVQFAKQSTTWLIPGPGMCGGSLSQECLPCTAPWFTTALSADDLVDDLRLGPYETLHSS